MSDRVSFGGKWQRWVAFGFGAGFTPIAPGTVGTLVGIPVVIVLHQVPAVVELLGTVVIIFLSIFVAGTVTRDIGIEDHPAIVIDEIAGYAVAMVFVPLTLWTIICGFLLFRLFDIYKPPPAGWLDRNCTGGMGITADDVFAGIYANLGMHGLLLLVDVV